MVKGVKVPYKYLNIEQADKALRAFYNNKTSSVSESATNRVKLKLEEPVKDRAVRSCLQYGRQSSTRAREEASLSAFSNYVYKKRSEKEKQDPRRRSSTEF